MSTATDDWGLPLRPSLAVGILLASFGVVLVFVPGVAALVPGRETWMVAVGAGAAIAGASLIRRRRNYRGSAAVTGDPEVPVAGSIPGDDIERQLRELERFRRTSRRARNRLRNRLWEAAIAVVKRRERVSSATAERMVADGSWTDDPHARLFLGDPRLLDDGEFWDDVRAAFSLRSRFAFEARRTIRAILDLAEHLPESSATGGPAEQLAPGPATIATPGIHDRATGRWVGVGAIALIAGAIGVIVQQPPVLLIAVIGVTYVAFARRARPPQVDVSIDRELSTTNAAPGDAVTVTVAVRNVGASLLPDLRLIDGVPPGLAVIDGSPRLGTALRPGKTARFSYVIEARRGEHAFGPVQLLARDASGQHERELTVEAPGTVTVLPPMDERRELPLFGSATRFTGRVDTDLGGDGVEFFATREYRPGDPPGRIDWNRHARTRDLATLLFRQERAATVVILIDTRETAYRAPTATAPHAIARSVTAAGQLFDGLLAAGDRVGLAAFGPRDCWIPPAAGSSHREAVRRTLATNHAFEYAPPDEEFLPSARVTELRRRAPNDAQFVFLSPFVDDYIATVARRLHAHGHPVTAVSPDPTTGGTDAQRLAGVERQTRLNELREAGIRVVDWELEEALAVALRRASAEWAA